MLLVFADWSPVSLRGQVHMSEDYVSFDFLCEDEKGILSELVADV